MRYSKQDIENHLSDILKLQCFVNAEHIEESDIDLNLSTTAWLKKYDFSQPEFASHIMEFYQIEEENRSLLVEIVNQRQVNYLIEFITLHGIRPYDPKPDFWGYFLQELKKKNVNIDEMKVSDEIGPFLQKNLADFVYALSRISSGRIKSFSISSDSKRRVFVLLLVGLILVDLVTLAFGFYSLSAIILIPLFILGLTFVYMQKKNPEVIQVNNYVTFQDMINDITDSK